jgi:radical SAM protein with 4Fe4S-binding SPASM domain
VRFTGGEPLLRPDFADLYVFSRKLGLKVILFTNATLVTPELARMLARIPPLEPVEVSVYGMTRESCEAVTRNPGSFEAARRGIDLLLEANVSFVVKGAIMPPNRRDISDLDAWAMELPWMTRPPALAVMLTLRTRRDSHECNQRIRSLRMLPEEALAILTRRPEGYIERMKRFLAGFSGPPGDRLFDCGAGCAMCCVDAYGWLQPCMMLKHPDASYDLKHGSLSEALTTFFARLRETRALNPDYLARCARCFLKDLCEQCPAWSWSEHGTLDTPVDCLCDLTHVRATELGLLKRGEHTWEVDDWKERIADFGSAEGPAKTV